MQKSKFKLRKFIGIKIKSKADVNPISEVITIPITIGLARLKNLLI